MVHDDAGGDALQCESASNLSLGFIQALLFETNDSEKQMSTRLGWIPADRPGYSFLGERKGIDLDIAEGEAAKADDVVRLCGDGIQQERNGFSGSLLSNQQVSGYLRRDRMARRHVDAALGQRLFILPVRQLQGC